MRADHRYLCSLLLLPVFVTGCELGFPAGKEPFYELNFNDMALQPKIKPQRPDFFGTLPNGEFAPPWGAVGTTDRPYHHSKDQGDLAGQELTSPLPHTAEVIAKGRWAYEHTCITCHGPEAAGNGPVTKLFPAPPSLMRQRVRDYADGRIFHVPMRGQGSMPAHAKQLSQDELWAIVHYLRDLQARLPVAPPTKAELAAEAATEMQAPDESLRP
ncbi:c-type cytochrome [Myxococcota bacterium]|nr:c-type cytochrome [Myxococcota bacterium]